MDQMLDVIANPLMKRYYVIHDAGRSMYEVAAWTITDVYLWCNYRFGKSYAGNANAMRKNAEPQTAYKVYDDKQEAKKLFPKARFSGLAEIPHGAGRSQLREMAGLD
jgi:GH35 family endo-1,4-beta-xylanase